MFTPMPDIVEKLDDQVVMVLWQRKDKTLRLFVNCFGVTVVNGQNSVGRKSFSSFEEGWKWFCEVEDVKSFKPYL